MLCYLGRANAGSESSSSTDSFAWWDVLLQAYLAAIMLCQKLLKI